DMGAHIMDQPYWALNLGAPSHVYASSTKMTDASYPLAEMITYQFPARKSHPEAEAYGIKLKIDLVPVKMFWYDGGITAPRPIELETGRRLGDGKGGVLFIGDKGTMMCGNYGESPRIIPESKMQEYVRPEKKFPRVSGHMSEWIECCKSGKKSSTDFSYSGPLTETMLLGCVAVRCKEMQPMLEWDAANMKFPNYPDAEQYLSMPYREGWTL
ncbi:gfo/Idh/MocA family oxidoreductase, partial [candidate division KSB1 bacterium]|nr:gfo/Idh/MocA family oxidoreductase [candidate division KSB1 bacterium]